jgi:hypothetical protein
MSSQLFQWLRWMLPYVVGLSAVGTTLGIGFHARPAQAQTAVQSVSTQNAQGTYETGVQRIVLGTTQGVNLSFIRTGETIQRVWLDDPSRVVVDFDGCLSSALSEASQCQSNSAGTTIVHIRQLSERINFPSQAVSGNGRISLLTVVTNSTSGRKIYQFQLVLQGGAPPHSLIEIIPSPAPTPAQLVSISQEYQQTVLRQLSQGLASAEASGLVDRTSPAYAQLQSCIALMQQGTAFAEAMQQSNVPSALVDQIRGLAAQTQAPQPVPSSTPRSTVPLPPVVPQ